MIVDPRSRFLLLHDVSFRPKYGRGKALPLVSTDDELDVLTVLQRAVAADTAKRVLRNDDIVRLAKVEVLEDLGLLALLFRRSDPDASAQMYEHRRTFQLRKADKTDDDAVTMSAHFFVTLEAGDEGGHTAALEEVAGIGRTYILQILLDALRDVTYETMDRRGNPQETQTLVEVAGIKGDRLGDAAGESRLEFIELVRPADTAGLDTEGLTPREERMIVRIEPEAADPVGLVKRVKEWAYGRDWSKVKVKINLPEDKSRLVHIAREAEAADILFVRAKKVDLIEPMEICTDLVNLELAQKARNTIDEQP